MDLTQVASVELLNRVEKLSRTERKITHLILWHLVEVERRRLFLDLGYTSLFKYLTGHLNYSEDAAYRRIQAARLLKNVPQLDQAIEAGDLNLTQMTHVQKCLNKERELGHAVSAERTSEVLGLIQNKSSFETKKILAEEFNQPIQNHEVIQPQRNDSVRMEITFNGEQMKAIEHVKELLSHVLPNPTWADLISYLAQTQIQKRLGKSGAAQFFSHKGIEMNSNVDAEAEDVMETVPSVRKATKVTTRRALLKNSKGQCEFVHSERGRCGSKFQLQVDHKVPLALGGTNELGNLRVLCAAHNRSEARRMGISTR